MKKNWYLWIIIIILSLVLVFMYKAGKKKDAFLRGSGSQVALLEKMLGNCQDKATKSIDSLELIIKDLKRLLEEKPKERVVRIPVAKKEEPVVVNINLDIDKLLSERVSQTPVSQSQETEEVQVVLRAPESKSSTPNLLPSYYYESGAIVFCVRLGGSENRHLPHLGIYDGIIAEENGLSGFNWLVTPISKISGDWGVTTDGSFFVSRRLIERYMSRSDNGLVEIKAPATNWQPKKMMIDGEYYVYHPNNK